MVRSWRYGSFLRKLRRDLSLRSRSRLAQQNTMVSLPKAFSEDQALTPDSPWLAQTGRMLKQILINIDDDSLYAFILKDNSLDVVFPFRRLWPTHSGRRNRKPLRRRAKRIQDISCAFGPRGRDDPSLARANSHVLGRPGSVIGVDGVS